MSVELLNIKEASDWATKYLGKSVTSSNISYLIQYGRIAKIGSNGTTQVLKEDLINYYNSYNEKKELSWRNQLGEDLNWALSFEQYKESETTKHVHRIHPYKGKFIPQLVEYFINDYTDGFKKEVYFQKGDIILDPFCGSGTTMVQACEQGMHCIGIDVSSFNAIISNCKISKYDFFDIKEELFKISKKLNEFIFSSNIREFEEKLLQELSIFNNKYFPVPDYKYNLRQKNIDETFYSQEKIKLFLPIYQRLVTQYNIKTNVIETSRFLDKWYLENIKNEIEFVFELIKKIKNRNTKKIVSLILSRTIRSCRATTHSDLATLLKPVTEPYYCSKHGKICKPIFSIFKWWQTYSKDTVNRLIEFDKLKTDTYQLCLIDDSRKLNIFEALEKKNTDFFKLVTTKKITGIFTSPPYVGLIDYHEQHAYAYDLFGFKRNDELEIGSLYKGQNKEAKENYIKDISDVLINCKKYLIDDYNVFLVANDKYNIYPTIAEKANMKIVNKFKRPVLNRTEKNKGAYSEIIFHLKENII